MRISHLILVLALTIVTLQQKVSETRTYDIVIYGATPAGIVAALSAVAVKNGTIAIVEATDAFGGMVVAGGIGLRDIGNTETIKGLALTWAKMNAEYYKVSYPVWQPDMYVGEANWKKLLAAFPNIEVYLNQPLYEGPGNVTKQGTRIQSIKTQGSTGLIEWVAKVFIDASYEGDLARYAQCSYTYGRESSSKYLESWAGVQPYTSFSNFLENYPVYATENNSSSSLIPFVEPGPALPPGSADDKMMGYSYRLCLTTREDNKAPFPKPPNYDPKDFVMLQRYIDTLVESGRYPEGPPLGFLVDIFNYRSYPPGDKFDMCDSSGSAFTSDVINLNEGYVTATWAQRRSIAAKHYYYVAGLLTYLSSDPRVPSYTRNSTLKYGLCKDQWTDNGNWPKQLYVREGLRIIGDRVFTQKDLVGEQCTNDSVGVGSWGVDIHVVHRVAIPDPKDKAKLIVSNEGQMFRGIPYGRGGVYELSYGLLLPKRSEATNLLVPVCNSATHVSYASIRVEPTFVQLGEAAGVAAALAWVKNLEVQDVAISELQSFLKENVFLHWPPGNCE